MCSGPRVVGVSCVVLFGSSSPYVRRCLCYVLNCFWGGLAFVVVVELHCVELGGSRFCFCRLGGGAGWYCAWSGLWWCAVVSGLWGSVVLCLCCRYLRVRSVCGCGSWSGQHRRGEERIQSRPLVVDGRI